MLQDVTSEEFEICMTILGSTKLGITITGHAELVALATEQSEINVEVDAVMVDDEWVERYIQCSTHALPYFSVVILFVKSTCLDCQCSNHFYFRCIQAQIETTPFVKFACEKFFPLTTWKLIGAGEADSQDLLHLRLLKVFAELSNNCGTLEKPVEKLEAIYNVLQVII